MEMSGTRVHTSLAWYHANSREIWIGGVVGFVIGFISGGFFF